MKKFYKEETITREMPGQKDCISMTIDGVKQKCQKHLILCTLREAYEAFKNKHLNIKFGFTKFTL